MKLRLGRFRRQPLHLYIYIYISCLSIILFNEYSNGYLKDLRHVLFELVFPHDAQASAALLNYLSEMVFSRTTNHTETKFFFRGGWGDFFFLEGGIFEIEFVRIYIYTTWVGN